MSTSTVPNSASARNLPDNVTRFAPHPGGQTIFLGRDEYEVFFGGTVGPGKTFALVLDAMGLQYKSTPLRMPAYKVPSYRAVLFRRTTTEFGQLIDEGRKLYTPRGARLVYARRGDPGPSFNFPSGARIFVCHMQHESSKMTHWGKEYQYVGFDELPEFTVTQYLFMFARLRSTVPHLTVRVRSTGNPAGPGVVWVRKRFIDNQKPYEGKYFLPVRDAKTDPRGQEAKGPEPVMIGDRLVYPMSRVYIPGYMEENPTLQNPEQYISQIYQQGEVWVRALLKHDWNAFAGDFFKSFSQEKVIDPFMVPKAWPLIGSLDPGYSNPCSFSLGTVDLEGNVYRIATYYERNRGPQEHADAIFEFIRECKWTSGRMPTKIVAGRDAWAKRDRYAVISTDITWADIFQNRGLMLTPAATDRVLGWQTMKSLMDLNKWFVFDFHNRAFIDEILAAVADEHQPEDILGRGNSPEVSDHALDDERYRCMSVVRPSAPKSKPQSWQAAFKQRSKRRAGWKPGMA